MKEWIDRYVHAVAQRLPHSQRSDIERELRGLIEDMLDAKSGNGKTEEERLEAVLRELGHPEALAAKYLGNERYLIGPGVFDAYVSVLKVVIASVLLGLTIAFIVGLALDPSAFSNLLTDYLAGLFMGTVNGFAWVTFVFVLVDRFGKRGTTGGRAGRKNWSPFELPPVSAPQLSIRKSEPIANLFFLVLGLILFLSAAGRFTFRSGDAPAIILLFDPETVRSRLFLVFLAFIAGLLREIGKLMEGKWTRRLVFGQAAGSLVLLGAGLLLFRDATVWNADFVREWVRAGMLDSSGEGYGVLSGLWLFVQKATPLVIIIGFAIDLVTLYWKLRAIGPSSQAR